jgi:hypothetical protein
MTNFEERRITPEMIKKAGDYIARVMDTTTGVGELTAEGIAEIFDDEWSRLSGRTSENKPPRTP